MSRRRLFFFLALVGMLAIVGIPSSVSLASVDLQVTGTPFTSTPVTPTATATLPLCLSTGTPTSLVPTSSIPTFIIPAFGTPGTPGSVTLTPTVTVTSTSTVSPTPAGVGALVGCLITEGYANTASCSVSSDGREGWYNVDSSAVGFAFNINSVRFRVNRPTTLYAEIALNYQADGGGSDVHMIYGGTYWGSGTYPSYVQLDQYAQSFDHLRIGFYTWVALGAGVADFDVFGHLYNNAGSNHVWGTVHVVSDVQILTPTVTPTPNVTVTPGSCVPSDGSVDTDLIDFFPPTVVPGACYTLLPNLMIDIPEAVQVVSPFELSSIGVPGIEVCVNYLQMTMRLLDFDVMSVLSFLLTLVCAMMIVREFRQ